MPQVSNRYILTALRYWVRSAGDTNRARNMACADGVTDTESGLWRDDPREWGARGGLRGVLLRSRVRRCDQMMPE